MENTAVLVVAVALSPFVVAALVWVGVSLGHVVGDRRRMTAAMGSDVVVVGRRGWARVAAASAAFLMGLKVIVATMSVSAAWMLGLATVCGAVMVVARGAVEPSFGLDDQAFERELRSFLDDAA